MRKSRMIIQTSQAAPGHVAVLHGRVRYSCVRLQSAMSIAIMLREFRQVTFLFDTPPPHTVLQVDQGPMQSKVLSNKLFNRAMNILKVKRDSPCL